MPSPPAKPSSSFDEPLGIGIPDWELLRPCPALTYCGF